MMGPAYRVTIERGVAIGGTGAVLDLFRVQAFFPDGEATPSFNETNLLDAIEQARRLCSAMELATKEAHHA